jgi:tRNA threonylcarbamoyladenosine biosynthesis protein TsaB
MRVLALDTTTRALSAAVVENDRVLAARESDPTRTHAERLPGDLLDVLAAAQRDLGGVDLFAVAAGPGSFTGLRIGIATMQGLAFVQRKRMVAVSIFEALAHVAADRAEVGAMVATWIDAHRRDVYSALYRVSAAPRYTRGRLATIDEPAVGDPHATLERWLGSGLHPDVFIGSGALIYSRIVAERASRAVVERTPPLAAMIGLIAAERAAAGESVDPAAVQPLYVRRPDAEIARDQIGKGR